MSETENVTDPTTGDTNEDSTTTEPSTPDTPPAGEEETTPPAEGETETEKEEEIPEDFTDFTPELPKGYALSDEAKDTVIALAKKHGMKKEGAQELINSFIEASEAAAGAKEEAHKKAWETQRADWETELKKEWGVDYDKNIKIANKAIDKYFPTKKAAEFVKTTAFNIAPHSVRAFFEIGKKISEDTMETGGVATGAIGNKITDIFPQPAIDGVT